MDREKLFAALQASGKIGKDEVISDYTDERLLKIAGEVPTPQEKPKDRLTNDELQELIVKGVDAGLKAKGFDKIDAKFLKLPGWEDTLNEQEKKMLENPSSLTPVQRKILANKQLRAFLAPLVNGQITKQNLALNTEVSGSVGQYLVPVQFISEISRLLEAYGVIRRNANIFQMTSKTATKPKLLTATSGAYVTETGAKSESNPTFDQITLTRHDYAYITGVTNQLLQDSASDLVGLLAELAAFDFARNEDNQCFNGTTLTDYLAKTGLGIVAVTTPDALPSGITNQNVINMIYGSAVSGPNSKWYFHRTTLAVLLNIVDDNHRPLYTLTDQLGIINSGRFMGYPYELVEVMQPSSGNNYLGQSDDPVAGDILAYFGDLGKTTTFGNRLGMDIAISTEATVGSNSAFEKNLTFWRFEEAHDFVVEQGRGITKLVLGS